MGNSHRESGELSVDKNTAELEADAAEHVGDLPLDELLHVLVGARCANLCAYA